MLDDQPMRHISSDPDLTSYRGFMDYEWAKAIGKQSEGTVLEYPVFDLTMSWKGSSNTFAMPLLMVEGSTAFWTEYSKSHIDQTMVFAIIQKIGERLCTEVEFTNMKQKQVKTALDRIVRDATHAEEVSRATFVFPTDELWNSYLTPEQPGTAEFHLILWTSQRLCFSSLIHAYEFFVQDVLRMKTGKPDSWRPHFSELVSEMKQVLGDSIADECLMHDDIDSARRVRNSLAHNGGRETNDLKGKHKIRTCPDGRLLIWPNDNRALFELLKDRASKIVDAALN
jgi:hypothetical protein